MPKHTKPDPTAIRRGDFFHLRVPNNRLLAEGVYRARIDDITERSRREKARHETTYRCSFPLTGSSAPLLDYDEEPDYAIRVHFTVTISDAAPFKGQAFLGLDKFPVEVSHEQNTMQRMKDSIRGTWDRPMPAKPTGKDAAYKD